jgi:hypothetical protein
MFKGCEKKDVGCNKFFNGCGSLNVHYNKFKLIKLKVLESKLQGFFVFFFLCAYLFIFFSISCFQD